MGFLKREEHELTSLATSHWIRRRSDALPWWRMRFSSSHPKLSEAPGTEHGTDCYKGALSTQVWQW